MDHTVNVGIKFFEPEELAIEPGDTIKFHILEDTPTTTTHSIETDEVTGDITVSPDKVAPWTKSDPDPVVTITGTAGTWRYFCGIHTEAVQSGKVVVGNA
jgi:plastocyanin